MKRKKREADRAAGIAKIKRFLKQSGLDPDIVQAGAREAMEAFQDANPSAMLVEVLKAGIMYVVDVIESETGKKIELENDIDLQEFATRRMAQ